MMLVVVLARQPYTCFLSPSVLDEFGTKTDGIIRYSQLNQYSAAHYRESPLPSECHHHADYWLLCE